MEKVKYLEKDNLIIGLAGDSGDGIQLLGMQLTSSASSAGTSVNALPDYPAEIRAPAGTVAGVSSYQLKIANNAIYAPGDKADILFIMNPAALKTNLTKASPQAMVIINSDAFTEVGLKKAGFSNDFLESPVFDAYTVHKIPVTTLTKELASQENISHSELIRSKNMFVLGVISWLLNLDEDTIAKQLQLKFSRALNTAAINKKLFQAGYNYAETAELFYSRFVIRSNSNYSQPKNTNLGTGNKAIADACLAMYLKTKGKLFVAGYPITPASTILQNIAKFQRDYGLRVFQAEDEISSVSATIGAAFAGHLSLTITSGPGFDLKAEALGYAVMVELPLVVLDVQRAGPSTGLPTKTEQSDLFAAIYGRHGEAPIPILAPHSPSDCAKTLFEAFQIAVKYMTPVIILSDAYIANSVEMLPNLTLETIPELELSYADNVENFQPFARNAKTLARPWAVPGMAGFEHCLGGLEKTQTTGSVSYEAENHQAMVQMRQQKILNCAIDIEQEFFLGKRQGDVLIVGWGSSYGVIKTVVEQLIENQLNVSMLHIRHIYPLPKGIAQLLKQFKKIVVVEQNTGHLAHLIQAETLIPVTKYNVINGLILSIEKLNRFLLSLLKMEDQICQSITLH